MIEEAINYHAGVGVLVKINAPGQRQHLPALIYVANEPYENLWSIGNAKRYDSISVQVSARASKGKLEPTICWLLLVGNPLDSQTTTFLSATKLIHACAIFGAALPWTLVHCALSYT